MNYNCSNWLDMRNLQEQVKKVFCYQKLNWPFTVWINCSSDKKFSRSLKHFFLTVAQDNFGNKIPFLNSAASSKCDFHVCLMPIYFFPRHKSSDVIHRRTKRCAGVYLRLSILFLPKLRWQDLAHYWPTTYRLLTYFLTVIR